jgi:hypothetical protein
MDKATDAADRLRGRDGSITELDRNMGYPHPCRHCGFSWGVHRGTDTLCPGTYDNGECWRGSWDRSPGTRYEPDT